jgi:hypothetical protein
LSKSFPEAGPTIFGKVNGVYKKEAGLTKYCKKEDIANSAKKNPEYEKISLMDNNKLYNCKENNHPKRVRSVVMISRRSLESHLLFLWTSCLFCPQSIFHELLH